MVNGTGAGRTLSGRMKLANSCILRVRKLWSTMVCFSPRLFLISKPSEIPSWRYSSMCRAQFSPAFVTALFLMIAFTLSIHGAAAAQTAKIIYTFQGDSDGAYPYAGLVADASGALYGTTYRDGTSCACGTVFKLIP